MSALSPAGWLILFVAGLGLMLWLRFPVGIALLVVSAAGAIILYGFSPGIEMTVVSMVSGLATFTLTAIPMFVLMGELFFRSGLAFDAIAAVERGMKRLPGRLAFISVGMGAVLGVLSGSVMASTAMLGGTLVPEMARRGYSPKLAVGAVLGSGGLAMILPPSTVVIVWGATAGVPVGPLLIAGILPGILMAIGYAIVVGVWAMFFGGAETPRRRWDRGLQANRAATTRAAAGSTTMSTKEFSVHTGTTTAPARVTESRGSLASLAGMAAIIAAVLMLILFGVATPTEAASMAVGATVIVLLLFRKLTWKVFTEAIRHTLLTTGMIFLIIAGAAIYGRVLAGSGSVNAFVGAITGLTANPYLLLMIMIAIVLVLGLFLEAIALVLITIPLFMPLVAIAGFDPIWFGMVMIIAIQIGTVTPPFGVSLFVIRQYAPENMSMGDIYRAAVPFVLSDLCVIALLVLAPAIVTFLPSLM